MFKNHHLVSHLTISHQRGHPGSEVQNFLLSDAVGGNHNHNRHIHHHTHRIPRMDSQGVVQNVAVEALPGIGLGRTELVVARNELALAHTALVARESSLHAAAASRPRF